MAKALINGVWVDVPDAYANNGKYAEGTSDVGGIQQRIELLRGSIPQATRSLVKTSITTPSLRHTYKGPSGHYSSQGGCTDGTYVYVFTRPSSDDEAGTIAKLRRSDWTTVKTASASLYHGNDFTYNPDTGRIYVATMYQPTGSTSRVAVIDPETLAVEANKTVPYYISCLAYNSERKIFVGSSGGGDLRFFRLNDPGDFESIKTVTPTSKPSVSDGWSSQGMTCDSAFIYHIWTNGSAWRIEITDWPGTYLGMMTGSQGKELEWADKISRHGFIAGQLTGGGYGDCCIYTFAQKP